MSCELQPTYEQTPVELLQEIQNSNKYLFHGSSQNLDKLEPRLPKGDMSDEVFNKTESVYATSSAARAVVSAIMPKDEGSWGTLQDGEGNITLVCSQTVLDQIHPGFVMVLCDRDKAIKDENPVSNQYKYDEAKVPLLTIPVTLEDFKNLGGKIEVI